MKLTVLKVQKHKSRYGQDFWYIFFKSENGQSFKSCVSPMYGNWQRNSWDKVVTSGQGCILEYPYLPPLARGLLDADISFRIVPSLPTGSNQ